MPSAPVTDEADIEEWRKGEDATIRLMRAIAAACKVEPTLNAWYNSGAGARRLVKRIDIGIAIEYRGRPHRAGHEQCRRARRKGSASRPRQAAHRARVERFVHVSGIGADTASQSQYIRKRGEGELAVQAAFAGAFLVRPAVMFGPDDAFLTT